MKWRKVTNFSNGTPAGEERSREWLRSEYLSHLNLESCAVKVGFPYLGDVHVFEESEIGEQDDPKVHVYPMGGLYVPLEIYVQYIMAVNKGIDRARAEGLAR